MMCFVVNSSHNDHFTNIRERKDWPKRNVRSGFFINYLSIYEKERSCSVVPIPKIPLQSLHPSDNPPLKTSPCNPLSTPKSVRCSPLSSPGVQSITHPDSPSHPSIHPSINPFIPISISMPFPSTLFHCPVPVSPNYPS